MASVNLQQDLREFVELLLSRSVDFGPNRIDLLTHIYGVTIDEIWRDRVSASLDGVPVMMIGREALIRNKRATARPQDLVDADKIEGR